MKSIMLIAVCITAAFASKAIGGTCSSSGLACMTDNDCLPYEQCIGSGGGGGNTTCTNTSQCYDGFYCKFTTGSTGICTPYPDCSSGCPNCDTTTWTAHSDGYQKRTVATCNTTYCICSKNTEYRCATGYYGTSTNGISGCTRCPSSGGVYGITASSGAKSITECYLPAGTTGSDNTGSFTYTGNCYYKN